MPIHCDDHQLIEMEVVGISREDKTTYSCFRCPIEGCLRLFKEQQGYMTLHLNLHIPSSNYNQVFCKKESKHGASMAIVGSKDGRPDWACVLCSPWLKEQRQDIRKPEGVTITSN